MADFEIKTESSSLAERRAAQKQRRLVRQLITGTILAVIVVVSLMVFSTFQHRAGLEPAKDPGVAQQEGPPSTPSPQTPSSTGHPPHGEQTPMSPTPSTRSAAKVVEDDGQTMWISPTAGDAVPLAYLPSGCQLLLVLRPAALLQLDDAGAIAHALGPRGEGAIAWLEQTTGRRLDGIERLVVALRPGRDFVPEYVLVVTPTSTLDTPTTSPGHEVFIPGDDQGTYVVAQGSVVSEVKEVAGNPPILRRELEGLLSRTDRDRHVTLLATPSFLFNEGRRMWDGQWQGLRSGVFDLLPDATQALSLSLHWGDDFFAELRVAPTIDQRPERFIEQFQQKIAAWPNAAEQAVLGLNPQPYSRQVVARLPAMLRTFARYTRSGRDQGYGLLRVYLPRPAGHNLLLAGELLTAEQLGAPTGPPPTAATSQPQSLAEKLRAPASLSFARDTLEVALQMLAQDSGIPIELVGADLQLEGITKNQSFGLDMKNQPAGDILLEILKQANPDKTASGPTDTKQKLVYVVVTDPESQQQKIKVTTRSQAEKRGEQLPRVFVQ